MRVLVTRPEPGAGETAARLEALGHEAVVLPLTETRTLEIADLPDADAVEAVAVTSASAVRHAPRALIAALSQKRCFAVGDRTAQACTDAGFRQVASANSDAAALAGKIAREVRTGTALAYLCGRVRQPDFETMLAKTGFRVHPIETYDTVAKNPAMEAVVELLGRSPVEAVLLYSQAGAEALAALAASGEVARLLAPAACFCLSARVARALGQVTMSCILVSPEPNEAALISMLAPHPSAKSFS